MENTINSMGENPLGYAPIKSLLMKFAIPSIISMLVNSLYNIVDQIFIGQGVGYIGNTATTVAFPIVTVALALSMLIGAGGSAYASIKLGERKNDVAEKTLGNVFSLSLIVGAIFAILCFIFLDPLLMLFGGTEESLPLARDYSQIILLGSPFMILSVGLSNLARTDGNPNISMVSMLVGAALNTVLDPIYIFKFGWGVKGAAIATITSQILSTVILTHYFVKKSNMRLKRSYFSLDFGLIRGFLSLGISSSIVQVSSTLLQIVMNNSLIYYGNKSQVGGNVAVSAMGIVMKISMILVSANIGFGTASQPIIGFNVGAKKPKRIKETYVRACIYSTMACVVGWLACIFIPEYVISIFGSGDSNFVDFGVKCLMIYMCGVFTSGFQIISTSYFQASGQALKASILSMLRQLIFLIPLILILPLMFGLDGILYAGPVADVTSAIVIAVFIFFEMKKINASIKEEEFH